MDGGKHRPLLSQVHAVSFRADPLAGFGENDEFPLGNDAGTFLVVDDHRESVASEIVDYVTAKSAFRAIANSSVFD
jgi:hypothetical protein